MSKQNFIWLIGAAGLVCLAFEVGIAVGQNAAPREAHGVSIGGTSMLDLGPELDSLDGRQLRVRLITFEPGGAVPLHSHRGRPGIATVLEGTLTEHIEGGGAFERQEGDRLIENRNTVHWAENRTDRKVMVLATDVFKP